GLAFKKEFDVTLRAGQTFSAVDGFGDHWTFVSQGVSDYDELNRHTTAVLLEARRNGKFVGMIKSEKRQYIDSQGNPTFEPATEVGILDKPHEDVYTVLAGVIGEDTAEMRITFNPLVWWVWYGGMIVALGGLIVMWPQADRRRPQAGYVAPLARVLDAQQAVQGVNTGTANVPMDEARYRPVQLPSRGTGPSMTDAQRDALEH